MGLLGLANPAWESIVWTPYRMQQPGQRMHAFTSSLRLCTDWSGMTDSFDSSLLMTYAMTLRARSPIQPKEYQGWASWAGYMICHTILSAMAGHDGAREDVRNGHQ